MPAYQKMKILKFLGYYVLLAVYYFTVFGVLIFTFDPPNPSASVNPIALFVSLIAITSPFLLVRRIIDSVYPGIRKRTHALIILIISAFLMMCHAVGTQLNNGIGLAQVPFYSFNICLFIALLAYKPIDEVYTKPAPIHSKKISTNKRPNYFFKKLKTIIVEIRTKVLAIIAMSLLILLFTNPSIQSFKEYIGVDREGILSRESNYFVCSIYKFDQRRYIGILSNFYYLKPANRQSNVVINKKRNEIQNSDSQGSRGGIDLFSKDTPKTAADSIDLKGDIDKQLDQWIKTHHKR